MEAMQAIHKTVALYCLPKERYIFQKVVNLKKLHLQLSAACLVWYHETDRNTFTGLLKKQNPSYAVPQQRNMSTQLYLHVNHKQVRGRFNKDSPNLGLVLKVIKNLRLVLS